MSFPKLMRYCLASVNPEGNLLLDSSVEGEVYRGWFLLMAANPYLVDEELFIRLVWEKCLSASPSMISEMISCSDTEVSSKSRAWSWKYEVSASEPKGISTSSDVKGLLFISQPIRKLNAMLMNRFLFLHFILLWQIFTAKIACFFHICNK